MPETITLEEFGYGLGPEAITYEILWATFAADACPRCQHLNGATWTLKELTGTLSHPSEGAVYDLDADLSLTHPNCRCYLFVTPQIELEKSDFFKELQKNIAEIDGGKIPSNIEEAKNQLHSLGVDAEMTAKELQQLERIILRSLLLVKRLGLPEDIDAGIQKIMHLIMLLRMLHATILMIQAASGPYGWALALVGAGVTITTTTQTLAYETRGH
jgi:hypothetical protein